MNKLTLCLSAALLLGTNPLRQGSSGEQAPIDRAEFVERNEPEKERWELRSRFTEPELPEELGGKRLVSPR